MKNGISIYIKKASNTFDRLSNNVLVKFGISSTQYKFLKFLYRHDNFTVRQKDMELYFGMANPTVTNVLKNLEQKDYIIRKQNPLDSRSKVIGLTSKAFECQKDLIAIGNEMEDIMTHNLSSSQKEELKSLLKLMLGE